MWRQLLTNQEHKYCKYSTYNVFSFKQLIFGDRRKNQVLHWSVCALQVNRDVLQSTFSVNNIWVF